MITDMNCVRRKQMPVKMNFISRDMYNNSLFDDLENINSPTPMASDDIWKKFELTTPPMSPTRDDDLDLENVVIPFNFGTDMMLFDDDHVVSSRELFPESPPDLNFKNLQSNLIQDPMWSDAPKISDIGKEDEKKKTEKRLRCDSCSRPNYSNSTCVAPEDIFPYSIGGAISQTRVHNLGIETPSDSEEEIDVVTVERNYQLTVPVKRKYDSDGESPTQKTKTVTLTIQRKAGCTQTIDKKPSKHTRVDCPTDVHNYSLPVTSLKRIHSLPSSPLTPKYSKKLKREHSIPSELRKVVQKLKPASSVSSSCSSSRSSSDSEEYCETGKRTQHNVLERKRRTDLKLSFFRLRDAVPELEGQERAPKVVILRKASNYIQHLNSDHRRYEKEIDDLKAKREKLKRTLAKLRDYY